MYKKIDLKGLWNFQLDEEKEGLQTPFNDSIELPGTSSYAKKGKENKNKEIGHLTDKYKFEGYAWYSREIDITEDLNEKNIFLYLERTRITTVWVDDNKVGKQNSLCSPHVYELSNYLSAGKHTITIRVDNTNYPTRGGHMTSPDTQSNWNGITGRIELQIYNKIYLSDIQLYPDIKSKSVTIKAELKGTEAYKKADPGKVELTVLAKSFNSEIEHIVEKCDYILEENKFSVTYSLGENTLLWSEFAPNLYKLHLNLKINGSSVDIYEIAFGMREFKAAGDKFTINGLKTFLRGKHDGLIFPLTGFAPTGVDEWVRILETAKSYGINHYRFHTSCPPEAAFSAADLVGIYMEPELPFWGTVTDESYEDHNQEEQNYLINEGFSILKNFANHPSFVMISLGNELWGSKQRINNILKSFKEFDSRPLYTQGSNNFQFTPDILENEDFFCGVRFSKDRLIRGSYAMCDAPLGHVQTDKPCTMRDYDNNITPTVKNRGEISRRGNGEKIEIQFGTEAKIVDAVECNDSLIPDLPVVSHEIGQYATYPDFREIDKYTGSLEARNFEIFKRRLEEKGLGHLAEKYFKCSGKLAVSCYKEELETAFRSKKLAGFQLLDLQDFTGQGTALVGILDAFMDPKGIVSKEEWCSFCSDVVLLARFHKFNYQEGESFTAHIELSHFRETPLSNFVVLWELSDGDTIYEKGEIDVINSDSNNYIDIADIRFKMPEAKSVKKLILALRIKNMDIIKNYQLWVYPAGISIDKNDVNIFDNLSGEAISLLKKGENVLLLPKLEGLENSIKGFYASDFWCYPMFRSISESMNKEIPVGTMGLLIDNKHPVFKNFPCEEYSTYQWWSIVTNSRSIILDDTVKEFSPIVQTIDNFERNHKLGLMFESRVLNGKLLVCACDFDEIIDQSEARQFLFSILTYLRSDEFKPVYEMNIEELQGFLC